VRLTYNRFTVAVKQHSRTITFRHAVTPANATTAYKSKKIAPLVLNLGTRRR